MDYRGWNNCPSYMDFNLRKYIFFFHQITMGMYFKTEFRFPPTPAAVIANFRQFISFVWIFSPLYSELGDSIYLRCEEPLLALGPATAGPGAPDFTLRDPELLPTSGRHLEMMAILFVGRWEIVPRAFLPQLFQCDGALVHSPTSPHYNKVSGSYLYL